MLPVLYQDDYMVAVHKPAGLLVHRSLIDKYETRFAMLRTEFDFQGLALNATEIAFNHPLSGQKLVIKSESEPRMQRLLNLWRDKNWERECPE